MIRELIEAEATALKKQYSTPPLRIGVEIPEKYTGPQTVEALMETFEAYDRQGAQGDTPEEDEKYPRAEWLAVLLEKEGAIRNYTDYSHWLGIRGNLIGFERDGNWVEGTQGVPPMDDWETFKAAYIDRQAWEHQHISEARQNDPNVRGGTFMGPNDRTFLPYLDGRVYVQRKERGASFFGEMLTQKQQWEIMLLLGKHPEGYETVYVDENGTILSEPPPPIPPPTGEERRHLEAWLKGRGSQQAAAVPDWTAEDGDDWDNGGRDRPVGNETVRAAAQKQFERAQVEAELEKQLTPEGIEAELSGKLSPDSFDKAQQLIDEYGTEEGLRRFREMDPDATERFESVPSPPFREQAGQERRPAEPAHDTSKDVASTQ